MIAQISRQSVLSVDLVRSNAMRAELEDLARTRLTGATAAGNTLLQKGPPLWSIVFILDAHERRSDRLADHRRF